HAAETEPQPEELVGVVLAGKCDGARVEAFRLWQTLPPLCFFSCRGQGSDRALDGTSRLARAELAGEQTGLLEVVSDERFQLDDPPPTILQPVGEALVERGPRRLRDRGVRGIAEQQVPEAERLFALEVSALGSDELLPNER